MAKTQRCCIGFLALLLSAASHAAPCVESPNERDFPAIALQKIVGGFRNPVHIAHAGDDSGRLFVVEQHGIIRIIQNGKVLNEPFLDIREKVVSGGEKGLLSVAFHPRYRENGYFYVNYTGRHRRGLRTVISRFQQSAPNRADPASEAVLLTVGQPYGNHNGGQLTFGPDGYLYIGMGDGGWANDPHGHGQNTATLLGALLRIDIDRTATSSAYAIPADNPFAGKSGFRGEIWAYGLRNPWRFSFDALNGRLYLADVGQNDVEEIDVIEKGGNYGWNIMEGNICTPGVGQRCDSSIFKPPILTYPHPEGFSITGGFVYRGKAVPGLCGVYLYADYVTKRIWGLRYDGKQVIAHSELLKTVHPISSFGRDQDLELYIADHKAGEILKVVSAAR